MWRVWWQKVQLHPALWTGQPWLQYFGVVISSIVQIDVDCCLGWVGAFQFCQHLSGGLRVDLLAFYKGELESLQIKRALDVERLRPDVAFRAVFWVLGNHPRAGRL